jgi:hypothetical protein
MKNLLHREGYPGECGYSIVARAHLASPYLSWKDTNKSIFGSEYVRLHPVLPGRLDAIASLTNTSINQLRLTISAHPLIAFGLQLSQKRILLMESELEGNASKVLQKVGIAASQLNFQAALKCCPACISRDEQYFGIPYWHIVHQIPGVNVCPRHNIRLHRFKTGEGGVSHKYILPLWENLSDSLGSQQSLFLSHYITELYRLLCVKTPTTEMRQLYQIWLMHKGYITKKGNIRWGELKPRLESFWSGAFDEHVNGLPVELSNFKYVPQLVHRTRSSHYIRHVLLMAFLTHSPKEFFKGPTTKPVHTHKLADPILGIQPDKALVMLNAGCSMRKIAAQLDCSVTYIKQLALRNHISINRRRKQITEDMEQVVENMAYKGLNRKFIADEVNISVGAVEQIIQSCEGLSQKRRELRKSRCLLDCQKELKEFIASHPSSSRTYIRTHCSAFIWLFKNKKEWLYGHLPNIPPRKFHPSVNWEARDLRLVDRVMLLKPIYGSLSEIDRELGGHGWLLKYRGKLPKTLALARELIGKISNE